MAYQSPLFNYGAYLSGGGDGLEVPADDVVDDTFTCSMCFNSYQKGMEPWKRHIGCLKLWRRFCFVFYDWIVCVDPIILWKWRLRGANELMTPTPETNQTSALTYNAPKRIDLWEAVLFAICREENYCMFLLISFHLGNQSLDVRKVWLETSMKLHRNSAVKFTSFMYR